MQVIGDPAVGATVIDIADPRAVPMTVNPLEPGPGQQVQAHADRLSGLFEAAFGPPDPVAAALRAGLRRAYAAGGWDLRTGWGPCPGRDPAVPSFRQVRLATLAAAVSSVMGRACARPSMASWRPGSTPYGPGPPGTSSKEGTRSTWPGC